MLRLGDYLYEYANGVYGDGAPLGRVPQPDKEIVTFGQSSDAAGIRRRGG